MTNPQSDPQVLLMLETIISYYSKIGATIDSNYSEVARILFNNLTLKPESTKSCWSGKYLRQQITGSQDLSSPLIIAIELEYQHLQNPKEIEMELVPILAQKGFVVENSLCFHKNRFCPICHSPFLPYHSSQIYDKPECRWIGRNYRIV